MSEYVSPERYEGIISIRDFKIKQLEKENAITQTALDKALSEISELTIKLETTKSFKDIDVQIMKNYKQQLTNQKYLDRQEVEKIFNLFGVSMMDYRKEQIITAICNLAYKIDKDKIREILLYQFGYRYDFKTQMDNEINMCADEIIEAIREE